jgi:hypothetical protein
MSLMTLAARLDYPFVTPPSPFSDQIEQATRQWVKQFNLLPDQQTFQRFCSINYGWLGARFFPYTSEAQATIGAQWIAWLFTLDDEFDESAIGGQPETLAQAFQKFVDILEGQPPAHQTPLSLALQDLTSRTAQYSPDPSWMKRFIISIQQYFNACRQEACNRKEATPPSPNEFIPLRQHAGAQTIVIALIEMMEGILLPNAVLQHPRIQALSEITMNLMGWGNDVLSVDKELRAGDFHNLVLIFKHGYCLNDEDAYTWAIETHNLDMRRFLLFETNLPDFGPDINHDVQRFIRGLRALIRGSVDWTLIDAPVRYAQVNPLQSPVNPHDSLVHHAAIGVVLSASR